MDATIRLTRDFMRQTFKRDHGPLLAGSPNPLWNDFLEMMVDQVFRDQSDQEDGPVEVSGLNIDKWSVAKVVEFCGTGVGQYGLNVFNYSAFVKLPLADLTTLVKNYLEGSHKFDDQGNDLGRKTWEEWQPSIPTTDTHAYIQLNGGGVLEDGRNIAKLVADGFNVIQEKQARNQIQAYQESQNPPV